MSNMSYCRFNNTRIDLDDCIEALEMRDISSEEEKDHAKGMIKTFLEFALQEGLIDFENEEIDQDALDNFIRECKER